MRIYHLAVLFSVALFAFHCDQPTVLPRTFAWLPEGDTLEVLFSSSGCVPGNSYDLVFQRSPEYTAVITALPSAGGEPAGLLGRIPLTRQDVDGLDNLFRLYRLGSQGSCTSTDRITLIQHSKGKVIATEQFIDTTCAGLSMDGEGFTTIGELVARVQKK